MHMMSLKIRSLQPIDTSIVLMKFGVDIKSKTVICEIVICNVLMNLLMYSIIVLGYTIFNYDVAFWMLLETPMQSIKDNYISCIIVSWDNQRIYLCNTYPSCMP